MILQSLPINNPDCKYTYNFINIRVKSLKQKLYLCTPYKIGKI